MTPYDQILATKLVAVIRLDTYATAVQVAEALVEGGISVLEFTLTGEGAVEAVGAARAALGDRACIGIGSVLHEAQARAAIDGGAQFLVTPAVRPAVIAAATNRDTLVLAGGITPSELLQAHEAGAALLKLFPARLGGPAYLKDILAPLPFLKLVPTGGVSATNAADFLAAGAAALGIGGNLVDPHAIAAGDFAKLTAAARACVAAVAARP